MTRKEIVVDLGRIGSTFNHEQCDAIYENDIALWTDISQQINHKTYSHDGISAEVIADWEPVIDNFKKQQKREREFNKLLKEKGDAAWTIYKTELQDPKVSFTVTIKGKHELLKQDWYHRFFIEKYIYDIFLIANLSLPGSCEFLNARFTTKSGKDRERYNLSSYNFEEGLYRHLEGKSPSPTILPIRSVMEWYKEFDTGVRQKAETSIEKAVFSLLHLCKKDTDETSMIWIFHALEAIYGTKVGEGFSNLIDRISILLELNIEQKKKTKKKLRDMYDYRSSIVHGGYKVHHPLKNEVIDRNLTNDYFRMFELHQEGFNLVVASIQKLIKNGWHGITFEQKLNGIQNHYTKK
jgi:hypothetical protein